MGPGGVVAIQRKGCHFAVLPLYGHAKVPSILKEASVEGELRRLFLASLLAASC